MSGMALNKKEMYEAFVNKELGKGTYDTGNVKAIDVNYEPRTLRPSQWEGCI
jgi:hypothetical protein